MPSEQFRMETVEALRNTRKGQLRYCRDWSPLEEDILEGDKSPPVLSHYTGWVLDKIIPCSPKSPLLAKSSPEGSSFSHGLSLKADASPANQHSPLSLLTEAPVDAQKWSTTERNQEPVLPTPPSKSTGVEGLIHLHKEIQKLKGKEHLKQRLEQQEQAVKAATEEASELLKRFDEMKELKQHQDYQHLQQEIENSCKEAQGQQEKLKEEHRRRAKLLSRKLREAEQQRQRQEDLERQRREESQERLRRLYTIQEAVLQIQQQLGLHAKHKELPTVDFSLYNSRGNQLCGEVSALVRMTNETFPTEADVTSADHALLKMQQLLSDMQQEIALVQEEKKKQEEKLALAAAAVAEAQKTEELQKQERSKSQASDPGKLAGGLQVKADPSIMRWYQELQKESERCVASFSRLVNSKDTQEKKIKMELQKAATIPISQISTIAGSQLKEIFEKVNSLLSGKYVQCGGHKISVTQHPEGLEFVYFKLAEKFVKQGEEEVASHHEAAFPIAVVASGIWELHPKVGTLTLAYLHRKCPYAVPFYPAMKEGTSLEEYQRTLGYQVKDGKVEPQDNFLKRMSGMIRLYAAILQLRWPYQDKQGTHPHGLNHAWRWVAQILNMEPLADVTATILFDFLEVCGNALLKQYQGQFWKMLLLIQEEYFPRIESITSPGEMGSLIRFKQFLKECLQRKNIPLPKGYLPASFWKS
ncbi:mRNA export factor GLE1 isoform X2 [Erythrolamprus reginae]|uniref:mRNA export factor GLE1 isoform X2 n=1 Tax=Erythrolamprus reginae TaxID=121349 RepID=UPI00396C3E1D